ncbi:MAG: glycosidase, partial [Bacteroidales bacterium]|nr:glycosidase [Bacteroidales bacterium]
MIREEFDKKIRERFQAYNSLIRRPNIRVEPGNGIYSRYKYPAITREHIPPFWLYDLDYERNPNLAMRLGVNTTFNAGAIKLNDKYLMVVR